MEQRKNGRFKVFEKPKQSKLYSIGVDVSEGLAMGDASTCCVLDDDYNQAACWYGRVDPDLLGRIACRIGKYYNNAILVPEVNNMGHTTLNEIKYLRYSNIYTRQVREELSDEFVSKIGFQTNRKTKHDMLNDFVAMVRDGLISLKDVDLLKEMSTLYIETDGNVELNGKDRTVAVCLAIQGLKQQHGNSYDAEFPGKIKPKTFAEKLDIDNQNRRPEQC